MDDTQTFLTCEFCHIPSADVQNRRDPYAWEINDEEIYMDMCDECYEDRVGDI